MRALCLAELKRESEAVTQARDAVATDSDSPFAYWTLGALLCDRRQLSEALECAQRAVDLDPSDPASHGLIAQIHTLRKDWVRARAAADAGLQIDPDDELCTSLRALAIRSTGSEEDWDTAIADMVDRYPASAWARAGRGWRDLELGEASAARQHFEQALALDPTSDFARDGLIESIKAGSPVYAGMLRVFLWLDRLPPRTRWTYILGGLLLFRVLRRMTEANPGIGIATYPLMAAWVLFILASWTSEPLSDFILSRTALGKRLVTGSRLLAAQVVASTVGAALLAGAFAALTGSQRLIGVAGSLAFLVLPVSAVFRCPEGWPRTTMAMYASAAAAAAAVVLAGPPQASNIALGVVIIMSVVGTWFATFLSSRVPAR